MEKSLFKDVPESIFKDFPNEDLENIGQAVVAGSYWSNFRTTNNFTTLSARLHFTGAAVTGIEASDIDIWYVTGQIGRNAYWLRDTRAWRISVSSSSVAAGGYVDVTARVPYNVSGSFTLALPANKVRSGGSTIDNAPATHSTAAGGFSGTLRVGDFPYFHTINATFNSISATLQFRYDVGVTGIVAAGFWIYQYGGPSGGRIQRVITDWNISVSASSVAAGGSVRVTATAPDDISGYYSLIFREGRAPLTGTNPVVRARGASTTRHRIYTRPFFATSFTTGGTRLTTRLYFRYSEDISGIEVGDFTVVYTTRGGTYLLDQAPNKWTTSVSSSTATKTGYVTITSIPPDDVNGTVYINLNANSLRKGTTTTNNAPKSGGTRSSVVSINNQPYWTNVRGGTTLSATLNFRYSGTLSNIAATDFTVIGGRSGGDTGVGLPLGAGVGWSISVSSSTSSGTGSITVTGTPDRDTSNLYYFTLKSSALTLSTVTGGVPRYTNISSASARVNSYPYWSNVSGGTQLSGTITFPYRNPISGISSSSFVVIDSLNASLTWPISVSATSISAGGSITVTAQAPADTNGSFRLRMKSFSATSTVVDRRSNTNRVPFGTPTSIAVTVNNISVAPPPAPATASWSNVRGGRQITGVLTFTGASVAGIDSSDFQIFNDSNILQTGWSFRTLRSSVTNGGNTTITATPPNDITGSYKIRLRLRSVRSGSGQATNNAPTANTDSGLVSINTLPLVASVSWENEAGGTTYTARLRFTYSAIQGIDTSDIEVLNSANTVQSNWSISLNTITVPTHAYMDVTATPPAHTNASYRLRVKALSMRSGGSSTNNFPTSAVSSDLYTVNNVVAAVARAEWSNMSGGRRITGTITFRGNNIRGFSGRDIDVVNAAGVVQVRHGVGRRGWDISTADNVISNGGSTTVTARPPDNVNGMFRLRLRALSVRSGNVSTDNAPAANVDSPLVGSDNTGTLATISWSSVNGGTTLTGTLQFANAAVSGLSAGAFNVINSSGQIQSGWLFDVPVTSVAAGGSITIICTPPDNTNDEFALQLRRRSLRSGGSGSRIAPPSALNTATVLVDNVSVGRARMTWVGTAGGTSLIGILRFSRSRVSGIAPEDFRVLSRNNIRQNNWTITVSHTSRNIGEQVIVTATAPANTNGWFRLQVRAFSMISGGRSTPSAPNRSITSVARQVDNRASIIATATWTSITGGETIVGVVQFNGANVRGITGQDFDVLDNSNTVQTGWVIGVSSTSASNGGSVTVTGAPPSRVDSLFKLRLKANRVRSDRSSTGNAPANDVISNPVTVDNIITIARASWINILGGNNLIGFLRFSDAGVEGVEPSDFQVLQASSLTPVDEVQDEWEIHVSKEDVIAGDFTIITATPPNNTFGRFYLKMLKVTVMSDGDDENNSPLNDVLSLTRAVDTRPVTIAEARWNSITGGTNLVGKLVFTNTFASSITSNAFRVQNSVGVDQTDWNITVSGLYNGGAVQNIEITVTADPTTANKRGAYRLKLESSSVKSGGSRTFNAPATPVISSYASVDNIPDRIATATWKTITGGTALKGTLTFHNAIVSGIDATDFEILNSSDAVQSNWNISVSSSIATPETILVDDDVINTPNGTIITVDAIPPANTNTLFKIRLKALSVMSDGVTTNNAPTSVTTSSEVTVNNTVAAIANMEWSSISVITGPIRLQGIIRFTGASVTQVDSSDFSVVDINNGGQNWQINVNVNPADTIADGGVVIVTATAPTNTNGNFGLVISSQAVRSGGSTTNNAPLINIISDKILVNNTARPPTRTYKVASASWDEIGRGDSTTAATILVYYVRPSTEPSLSNADRTRIRNSVSMAQTFYANQMESHGYGGQTFNVDTDSSGNINVEEIILTASESTFHQDYKDARAFTNRIRVESRKKSGYISLFFVWRNLFGNVFGFAEVGTRFHVEDDPTLYAVIDGTAWTWQEVAHELGHNFGLQHINGGDDVRNIMNVGSRSSWDRISVISAKIVNEVGFLGTGNSITRSTLTTTDTSITGELRFYNANITELEATDITVLDADSNDAIDNDWSITLSKTSVNENDFSVVMASPILAKNGNYKLRLNALTVKSDGSPDNNSPRVSITSNPIGFNSKPVIEVESFRPPQGIQSNVHSVFVLELSEAVPISQIGLDDFTAPITPSGIELSLVTPPLGSGSIRVSDIFHLFVKNPENSNGTYQITFNANSIETGDTYLQGPANPYPSNAVIYDTRVINWSTPTYNSTTRILSANIQFGKAVSGVSAIDFEIINDADNPAVQSWPITVSASSANANTNILVSASVPSGSNDEFAFRLKTLSVQLDSVNAPTRVIVSEYLAIDSRSGITPATARWTTLSGNGTLNGRVLFNETTITELKPDAFEVLDTSNTKQNNWNIVHTITRNPTYFVDVVATPNSGNIVNADFKFKLLAESAKSGGSATFNTPVADVISGTTARVTTKAALTVASFEAPDGVQWGLTSTFKLTLNRAVDRFLVCATHFTVQAGSGASIDSVNVTETTGSTSDKFDIVVTNPTNRSGSYYIRMNANVIPETDDYQSGPPTNPIADRQSNTVGYNTTSSGITATWGPVTLSERVATSIITFSSNPGSGFNVSQDVRIQKKTGLAYNNEALTAWDLTSTAVTGQAAQRSIKADPSPSVEAGTYRFILVSGALGSGTGGQTSNDFTIGDEMATPAVTINNGFFDPDSDIVRFYISWTNVTPAQLRQFDRDDIEIKDGATGGAIMGIGRSQITVQNADGNTYPVDIRIPANLSGSLYIRVLPNRFMTTSYAGRSASVDYNTIPMTTPTRATFTIPNVYSGPRGGSPITARPIRLGSIYIEFSSSVSAPDFTSSDIVITGGCPDGLTNISGTTPNTRWRLKVDIDNNTKGTVNAYVIENSVSIGNDSVQAAYKYDRTSGPTVTPAQPTITGPFTTSTGTTRVPLIGGKITATTFHVRIDFNEDGIEGFFGSDIMVVNACRGALTRITEGRLWSLEIGTQAGFDGRVNVLVPAGVTTQSGSNAAVSRTYEVRRTSPTTTPDPVIFTIGNAWSGNNPLVSGTRTINTPFGVLVATVYVDIAITNNKTVSDFTASDISVGNGCIGRFTTVTPGRRWTIEVGLKEESAGYMDVTIPPNVVADGNPNVSKSFEFNRITTASDAKTVTIGNAYTASRGGSALTGTINTTNNSAGSFFVEILWSAEVTGFTASDILVANTCKGGLTETVDGQTRRQRIHIDPEDNFDGWVTVAIPANVIDDSGGNLPDSREFRVDYSTTRPPGNPIDFTIGGAYPSSTTGSVLSGTLRAATVYVLITADRSVDDFGVGDIIIGNGCKGTLTELSGGMDNTRWRIEVGLKEEESGTMTVTVPPNAVVAGNENATRSFEFNRISSPSVTSLGTPRVNSTSGSAVLGTTNGKYTAGDMYIPINFTTAITGFQVSDVTVINACKGGLTTIRAGFEYRIHVDNEDDFDGIVTIQIATDITSQPGGNTAISRNYNVNTTTSVTKANITIGEAFPASVGGSRLSPPLTIRTVYINIQSDINITLTASDINVSGGCKGGLTPVIPNRLWRIQVALTNETEGIMTVWIPPNTVSGNDNVSRNFKYELITEVGDRAILTIDPNPKANATALSPSVAEPITVTGWYVDIQSNKRISGLSASDITVTNACAGSLITLLTGRRYRLHINNEDDFEGVVTISIPTDVINEAHGNLAATENYDVKTTSDPDPPAIFTIGDAWSTGGHRQVEPIGKPNDISTILVQIDSNVVLTDFTVSDIFVTNGCLDRLQNIVPNQGTVNTRWFVWIGLDDNTKGRITVAIPPDVVSRGNAAVSKIFRYDRTDTATPPATVTIGDPKTNATGTTDISLTNGNVTAGDMYIPIRFIGTGMISDSEFTVADVTVINACKGALTRIGTGGRSFIVHVDNKDNFRGVVTVQVATDSIGDSGNHSANKNFDVDTTDAPPPKVVFSIKDVYNMETGGTVLREPLGKPTDIATVYIEIESNITANDFTVSDIDITGGCKGTLTPITPGRRWRIAVGITDDTAGTILVIIPLNIVSVGNDRVSQEFSYDRRTTADPDDPARPTIKTPRSAIDGLTVLRQPIREDECYIPISFDRDVMDFVVGDVVLNNACKGALTPLAGGTANRDWILHVDNRDNYEGTITVTIPPNVTSQSGGNEVATRNYDVNTTTPDPVVTTFTIGSAFDANMDGNPLSTGGPNSRVLKVETVWIQITSTQALMNFTPDHIIISGACKGIINSIGSENKEWRLQISLTEDTAGVITVSIPANVVDIGNALEEKQFKYDRQTSEPDSPHLRLLDLPDAQVTGRIVTLRLQSYLGDTQTNIDGLTADDIIVTSDDDVIHRLS